MQKKDGRLIIFISVSKLKVNFVFVSAMEPGLALRL